MTVSYVGPVWGELLKLDTRGFGPNAWTSITDPHHGDVKRQFAAFGKSIHGLHYGSKVLNTLDFGTPYEYDMSGRFNAGVSGVSPQDSVANGYLAGSARMFKIPGVPKRTPTEDDIDNRRAWKDYSIISTNANCAHGMQLGRNAGIFGTTPGNCFAINFLYSTGSAASSRKFFFKVQNIGQFDVDIETYTIDWDSGAMDRTASSIITSNLGGAATNFDYGFKVLDWNSSGTKCIVAAFIHNISAIEDDGVNMLHTWPFAFVEFTFAMGSENKVTVSGSVIQRYLGTANASGNSYVSGAGAIVMPGRLRKYDRLDGTVTPVSYALVAYDTQTYYGAPSSAPSVIFEGSTQFEVLTSVTGKNIYMLRSIPQAVGQARFVSSGTGADIRMMRTIHMCYNSSETLVPVTVSFSAVLDPLVEVTKSISMSGQGTHTRGVSQSIYQGGTAWSPQGRFVNEGSGASTFTYVVQREKYTRRCIELRVGGTLVDYMQVEYVTPTVETTYTSVMGYSLPSGGASWVYGETSNTSAVVNDGPVENVFEPPESAIAGPLNWIGGYDPLRQAGSITDFIRNTAVPDSDLLSRLRPFARVESNKIVSFMLGDDAVSVGKEDALAAGSWYFQQNVLLSGNHVRRTVYDCFNGRLATNNVSGFGNSANPARNIPAAQYHCTLNPARTDGESVINSPFPVTIVGNA